MFRFFTQRFVRGESKPARRLAVLRLFFGVLSGLPFASAAGAWEPDKPVELIVISRQGSDLDQHARLIQEIIAKYNLMKQPLHVANKTGDALMDMKNSRRDAYRLLIANNYIFTRPMTSGMPFTWKDTSPIALLGLEQFVLWTNSRKGYKSVTQYVEAVKAAGPGKFRMGGYGGRQADFFLTLTLEWRTTTKFEYVPFRSGAEVVEQLAESNIDSSVSNPVEALAHWRSGALTAQCVFDDTRMPYTTKITTSQSWSDIPTCREVGILLDYQDFIGTFLPPDVGQEQVRYFVDVFKKVVTTPEWKTHMEKNLLKPAYRTGSDFTDWLALAEDFHLKQAKKLWQEFRKENN